MPETLLIRDDRSLGRLVERLADVPEAAFDTEFLRERTYYAKLCLIQIGTPELLALVDPLAVRDLSPLWAWLTGGVEVLLHAAAQDLEIVHRACGAVPRRHFDTQVAAAFLGYGDAVGYAKLVNRVLGVPLPRSEAYTDWSRRPLSAEQREYALDDVRYLPELAEALRGRLRERGRLDWLVEELEATAAAVTSEPDPEQQWRRVSGARALSGRSLAILREVTAWREREARRRNVPRGHVVPDRVLIEIARRAPSTQAQVERLRGMHPREAQRSAGRIVELVRRARDRPESEWPAWPPPPPFADDPRVDAIAALLDAWVRTRATELELSSRLLARRSDLERLALAALAGSLDGEGEGAPQGPPLMRGWRARVIGRQLLEVLRGEATLGIESDEAGPHLRLQRRGR